MPHQLVEIDGPNVRLASEPCASIFTTPLASIPFLFLKIRELQISIGGGPGAAVPITVTNLGAQPVAQIGEFILLEEGGVSELTSVLSDTPGVGVDAMVLKALVNAYTPAGRLYSLEVFYDRLKIVDPNPLCKEITTISLYGTWRDQMLFRALWAAMTQDEFDFMVTALGQTVNPGTRDEQIDELICDGLFEAILHAKCDDFGINGPGNFSPDANLEDGGQFVSHSCASFEDQFEEFAGVATFDEYIFEIPFDTFLTRASIYTNASTAADAYVTITKNDVFPIVAAGPVPPNRNLPAVTGVLKGLDLANIPVVKGDKITVRLNLPSLNTVKRASVVIGHAPRLINL
jgi:hypothetical protein